MFGSLNVSTQIVWMVTPEQEFQRGDVAYAGNEHPSSARLTGGSEATTQLMSQELDIHQKSSSRHRAQARLV